MESISIAMCTYNGSRFLQEELDSIAIQTRLPDEMVVCDDGSQDETVAMLERFRERVSFPVRIVRNEQNLGRTRNFAKAVSLCKGTLIALADFDDVWYAEKLEVLGGVLTADRDAAYAFCDADLIDASGKPMPRSLFERGGMRLRRKDRFAPQYQVRGLLQANVATGAAMLMRADLLPFVLPIPENWVQDYWMVAIAAFMGKRGIPVYQRLMKYRIHTGQMSGVDPGISHTIAHTLNAPQFWKEDMIAFRQLREAIHSRPQVLQRCRPEDLQFLDDKIAHLAARTELREVPLAARYKNIVAEMRTGRYGRYSLGWMSTLRDFLPIFD